MKCTQPITAPPDSSLNIYKIYKYSQGTYSDLGMVVLTWRIDEELVVYSGRNPRVVVQFM